MLLLPSHDTVLQKCEQYKACKQIKNKISEFIFCELSFLQLCYSLESLLTCTQDSFQKKNAGAGAESQFWQ